jgi:hypothetical protein
MAASMWLVRCGCRRRSNDRGAGADGTRLTPREPVPEGSSMPDVGDGGGRPELGTTPIPVRPPDKTLALPRSVVKGV